MDKKPEKLVIVLQESTFASLIKDAGTFLLFAGLLYFNHAVLGGSTWVDILFILLIFTYLAGRQSSRLFQGSVADAIKWLEGKK